MGNSEMVSLHGIELVPDISVDLVAKNHSDGTWLDSSVPAELAQVIADDYDQADRERLLEAALTAALAEEKDTYTSANPMLTNVARNAARYALGLKPLPRQEGDN